MYDKTSGGLRLERPSFKDFSYEKIFGSAPALPRSLGRLDEVKASPLVLRPKYQADIPSCVVCTVSWINEFFSWKKSNNDINLSWPYLFTKSDPTETGTKPRIVAQVARKEGMCEDQYFPQKNYISNRQPLGEKQLVADLNARKYQMKNFSYLNDLTSEGFFRACSIDPIAIGLYVDLDQWNTDNLLIKPTDKKDILHMVALIDFTHDGDYVIVNWWKEDKIDIRILDKSYPIITALSFEDLPDGFSKEDARPDFFESLKSIFNFYVRQFKI